MQFELQNKSRSLLGVTDLTLAAPIKRGLIPALDSRSYESRLRVLLRTLSTLRVSSLEAEPTPLIADAVDRIRAIHSFRLAIVGEDQRQLLLAVAFDGGWEPYMRRIWRDLGPLLDVIFCNCEGYLISREHVFAEYAGWVRRAQVATEFFYNASPLTVSDLHYLREAERRRRDCGAPPAAVGDKVEQAMPALTALYRLTDLYPPASAGIASLSGPGDGACLLRAAHHLLHDVADDLRRTEPASRNAPAERAALAWFRQSDAQPPREPSAAVSWDPSRAQGGIVEPYAGVSHACLLLIEFADEKGAAAFVGDHTSGVLGALGAADGTAAKPFVNVGFTAQGLKVAGVPAGTLEQFPFEFREGMAARASILGDLHYNHPTRWTLPERNWPERPSDPASRVEMTCVHAIVQLSCRSKLSLDWDDFAGNDRHPLRAFIRKFHDDLHKAGVRILSVQAMQRFSEGPETTPRGHFGFLDGISQPSLEGGTGAPWDRFKVGDLFLGHENSVGDEPVTGRLWDDSTFLVVRKLRQDVAALDDAVAGLGSEAAKLAKAKMMGRRLDGENLVDGRAGNDFDFSQDPDGGKCPLQSHIRRANPRALRDDLATVPRIVRRGMSYGPRRVEPGQASERGVVFMAYCASIAEQFEVIQAWLSGGNSTGDGSYSGLRDPFIGVPQPGDPHTFVYRDDRGREVRLPLDPDRPFVKLEWGAYLFVPSIRALEELKAIASEAPGEASDGRRQGQATDKREKARERERTAQAMKGAAVIGRLQLLEQLQGPEAARTQWKIALEDVSARISGMSQFIWTAIREHYGGTLRTPYGVLVGSRALVMQVFDNRGDLYSVQGYADRMKQSFGEIYLGMDRLAYARSVAGNVNEALMAVTEHEAFESARHVTGDVVRRLVPAGDEATIEVKDLVDEVLAALSAKWFGIPDPGGSYVVSGGWHWRGPNELPTCPGHFHSPSRYMFQPDPGTEASEAGQRHGQALYASVRAFVDAHRGARTRPQAPLGKALFEAIPGDSPDERSLLASTLIGVMMGFLPTVDGNLRGLFYEWMNDRSLWDHEGAYLAADGHGAHARAHRALLGPLRRTLQLRPVPEVVWRIALKQHRLGTVTIEEGETVVVGIVSAMQEARLDDVDDVYPVFGGNRGAKPHPLHACPGYAMAMGVMLGVVAGLLEAARPRPTLSPFALRMARR